MFAFPKLVLLILLILAVWYGLRWLQGPAGGTRRGGSATPPGPLPPGRAARRSNPFRPAARQPVAMPEAQDLVRCAACGAYAVTGGAPCERSDCPRIGSRFG